MCRGSCYTKKAGNIGLVLRRAVAQGLRVMGDDDMDVCCSGADAPPKVFVHIPSKNIALTHFVLSCWTAAAFPTGLNIS